VKLQLIGPAAPTFWTMSWKLFQFGAPGTLLDAATQVASTAIANAAAGAGTNYFEAEAVIKNSVAVRWPCNCPKQFRRRYPDHDPGRLYGCNSALSRLHFFHCQKSGMDNRSFLPVVTL